MKQFILGVVVLLVPLTSCSGQQRTMAPGSPVHKLNMATSQAADSTRSPRVLDSTQTTSNLKAMVMKTEEEWKKILTPQEYRVLRQKATDRPFTGEYVNTTADGIYSCRACGAELYKSDTKFDSHCGWPSFYAAIDSGVIVETPDNSFGMKRTELTCARCGSHLGHIFDDGPEPTGMRHCINSTSLRFSPAEKKD